MEFTAPGDDADAFALIKKNLEAAYQNRERDPGALYGEKVAEVNTGGHYSAKPLTPERIAKLDRSAMTSFYKARFANAADFTFFMVGAFKIDEVLPLVAKYVGSLPSTGTASAAFKQMGAAFPQKIVREQVAKGREPRAQTILSFAAEPPLEENEQSRVEAATDVLEIALRDILREELGETYGVWWAWRSRCLSAAPAASASASAAPPTRSTRWSSGRSKRCSASRQEGPSEDLTNRAKETARRAHETAKKQNGFWLGRLQSAKLLGRDPNLILTREQRIDAINRENIHEMFKKYFPMERYTVVTLVPEQ